MELWRAGRPLCFDASHNPIDQLRDFARSLENDPSMIAHCLRSTNNYLKHTQAPRHVNEPTIYTKYSVRTM